MTTLWEECHFIWQEALEMTGGDRRLAAALRDRVYEIARTTPLTLAEAWQKVKEERDGTTGY